MVTASVFGTVDSGLIPSRVKPMTLRLVLVASLLDAQHYWDSAENKPPILLVASLQRHLAGLSHLGVVDKWPATSKRARYSALIAFS